MASTDYQIIYQETNPYSSMTAFLEDDGRTIYLYLQSQTNPEYPMKSVWVKNRITAPESRSAEDLQSGLAPLLCSGEITAAMDTTEINSNDVSFIWFEEGNGLALFVQEQLYAVIPPWSGIDRFHGYAKFAAQQAITAHPLGDSYHGPMADRIEAARKFWQFRSQKDSWITIRDSSLSYLESRLGPHKKYWSADGGNFPLIGIARFEPENMPGVVLYATIGMSGQNMPAVELYHKEYLSHARIELIFALTYRANADTSESWIPHYLGDLVKYPWHTHQWLGNGHTIALNRQDPDSKNLNFSASYLRSHPTPTILDGQTFHAVDLSNLKSENGEMVQFLYLLPITEEERQHIIQQGSTNLSSHFEKQGFGWLHISDRNHLF